MTVWGDHSFARLPDTKTPPPQKGDGAFPSGIGNLRGLRDLFRRFGARHDAPVTTEALFEEEHFPPGHEAEIRFRIGPIGVP